MNKRHAWGISYLHNSQYAPKLEEHVPPSGKEGGWVIWEANCSPCRITTELEYQKALSNKYKKKNNRIVKGKKHFKLLLKLLTQAKTIKEH